MTSTPPLDAPRTTRYVDEIWNDSIVPTLVNYIRIPNVSPLFDAEWQSHGHMAAAAKLLQDWCRDHAVSGMQMELVELPGRTPVLFIEIPGEIDDTVLLYGHFDKQPEMDGWSEGLGPWEPVIRGDRLYGRGGADDGYSTFASLTAIKALHEQGIPHARCVILIEGCEESGSFDLPHYIDHLADRIGTPSLVVCLDSGACNYDQMWCTTSLRGMVNGSLHISLLREGIHSGDASGMVPSSFRILRILLDRLEDTATGKVRPRELQVEIPDERRAQAAAVADALGSAVYDHFPFQDGVRPLTDDVTELLLNRTWRSQLEITGGGGMPPLDNAGNVMRAETAVKISLRLPPMIDGEEATRVVRELLEADPPYGAHVSFSGAESSDGWNAPPLAPWLESSLSAASCDFFGADCMFMGEGGTIPFMGMLGDKFPNAQFMITGLLGPESNAHGPNEFLHVPTARKLTACVARVLRDHAAKMGG